MPKLDAFVSVREDFCIETRPDTCGLIIFGASGDLAQRKLIPALFGLYLRRLLPDRFYMLGFARSDMGPGGFQKRVGRALDHSHPDADPEEVRGFLELCRYVAGDYDDPEAYELLSSGCSECDQDFDSGGNRLFYLALPPRLHAVVVDRLAEAGLTGEGPGGWPWSRVVIEKPFGRDLASALELDDRLARVLKPGQIYRMDHYLGKETVQSILMFRFANLIFEPLWNRRYIDHVQITVAEGLGVEHRGAYYEGAGLLRDMFQNHMLQLLSLVAMEPPTSFESERVRDEKVKLLRSIRPWPPDELGRWLVRGQYGPGRLDGADLPGYRQEPEVAPDSRVETFVAAKLMVDNWRWQGVPFYLRSGKRLAAKVSEIAIIFKHVPHSMFGLLSPDQVPANALVLNVQPEEGVSLLIQAKQPGPKSCMSSLALSFNYRQVFGLEPPEAYERLLLDCMLGDQTLFWRRDGVEAAWSLITPVLESWAEEPDCCPLEAYPAGSWGPAGAERLLAREDRTWRRPLSRFG